MNVTAWFWMLVRVVAWFGCAALIAVVGGRELMLGAIAAAFLGCMQIAREVARLRGASPDDQPSLLQ